MKGWIYVATMSNTVGVVKIGYSERDPDERVKEWSRATGAPGEGKVEYTAWVKDAREFEKRVHDRLNDMRQEGSEWFKCDVDYAINTGPFQFIPFIENFDFMRKDLKQGIICKHYRKHNKQYTIIFF